MRGMAQSLQRFVHQGNHGSACSKCIAEGVMKDLDRLASEVRCYSRRKAERVSLHCFFLWSFSEADLQSGRKWENVSRGAW